MYNQYDLSHNLLTLGRLGRLMTLGCPVPVVAGDRIKLSLKGLWTLSPLRRHIAFDAKVDLFSFFIPYRFLVANRVAPPSTHDTAVNNWVHYLEAGPDGAFKSGVQSPYHTRKAYAHPPLSLGFYASAAKSFPDIAERGYCQIWNHYFRDPTNQGQLDEIGTNPDDLAFGRLCSHLQTMHTTPVDQADFLQDADFEVDVASNKFDLREVAQQHAHATRETERAWLSQRYRDILKREFNGKADPDSDFRPWLLAHSSFNMSGYEINGTDSTNLGQSKGKSVARNGFSFPRRFFPEHGLIYSMVLVRYPPIFQDQAHRIWVDPTLSYEDITGDPEMLANMPPEQLRLDKLFYGANSSTGTGYYPKGQHFRCHPHQTHPYYSTRQAGFPILPRAATTDSQYRPLANSNWEDVFQSVALEHWQLNAWISMDRLSLVPPASSSIFTGTG